MPREIPESAVYAAIEEMRKVRKDWLRRPEVTAVDVGFKIKDGPTKKDGQDGDTCAYSTDCHEGLSGNQVCRRARGVYAGSR